MIISSLLLLEVFLCSYLLNLSFFIAEFTLYDIDAIHIL